MNDVYADLTNDIEHACTLADADVDKGFVPTTSLALNYIMSGKFYDGGIPVGALVEIFGPSGGAKTAVMTMCLQGAQSQDSNIAALIDTEGTYGSEMAAHLKLDPKKLVMLMKNSRADNEARTKRKKKKKDDSPIIKVTVEEVFRKIREFVTLAQNKYPEKKVIVGVDSAAAIPGNKEFDEFITNGDWPKADYGDRAKAYSQGLRLTAGMIDSTNITTIFTNQMRDAQNTGYYGPTETTGGGGRSLEYYGSVRLKVRKRSMIFQGGKKDGRIVGIQVSIEAAKNKVTAPFRKTQEIKLYFDHGFDPCSGLLELMIRDNIIGKASNVSYALVDPATRDDVEPKILEDTKFSKKQFESGEWIIDHPEVFGCPDSNTMRNYLKINEAAIQMTAKIERGMATGLFTESFDVDDSVPPSLKNIAKQAKRSSVPDNETGDE